MRCFIDPLSTINGGCFWVPTAYVQKGQKAANFTHVVRRGDLTSMVVGTRNLTAKASPCSEFVTEIQ